MLKSNTCLLSTRVLICRIGTKNNRERIERPGLSEWCKSELSQIGMCDRRNRIRNTDPALCSQCLEDLWSRDRGWKLDCRKHLRYLPHAVNLTQRLHNIVDHERNLCIKYAISSANNRFALSERVPCKTDTRSDAGMRRTKRFAADVDLVPEAVIESQVPRNLPGILCKDRKIREPSTNDTVTEPLLICLRQTEIERLDGIDRRRRKLCADKRSGQ